MNEAALLRLARETIIAVVRRAPPPIPAETTPPRAVFVTIERRGKILGCRGTLEIRGASLESAVQQAAQSAARHDPHYRPLTERDLADFLVTITVVEKREPITRIETLVPGDGLVLRSGERIGVVLPWEGRDPRTRLRWAFAKAGVSPNAPHMLECMTATRFRG